jgi:hypothetical protein
VDTPRPSPRAGAHLVRLQLLLQLGGLDIRRPCPLGRCRRGGGDCVQREHGQALLQRAALRARARQLVARVLVSPRRRRRRGPQRPRHRLLRGLRGGVRGARRAHRAVGRGRLAALRLGVQRSVGGGRDWREREVAPVVARELLRQARGPGERPPPPSPPFPVLTGQVSSLPSY